MRFRFRKNHPLPDPVPPLRDFWVSADVALHEPIEVEGGEDPPMIGYIRNFGVRAAPGSLQRIVEHAVRAEGTVRWENTEWDAVDPQTLHRDVCKRITAVEGEGIWYTSGRAFFPADNGDDE